MSLKPAGRNHWRFPVVPVQTTVQHKNRALSLRVSGRALTEVICIRFAHFQARIYLKLALLQSVSD